MTTKDLQKYLDLLYKEATSAAENGEIPVSCLLVLQDDTFILTSNKVEEKDNPFQHAEILALENGLNKCQSRYLKGATLLVSLEPCLMCMGAIIKAGISQLIYVLDDPKKGALSHYHVCPDESLEVLQVEDKRFEKLMDDFFKKLRKKD